MRQSLAVWRFRVVRYVEEHHTCCIGMCGGWPARIEECVTAVPLLHGMEIACGFAHRMRGLRVPVAACAGEPIDQYCARLLEASGVLLLPATVYDHAPSTIASRFRLGLGRENFKECIRRWADFESREAAAF